MTETFWDLAGFGVCAFLTCAGLGLMFWLAGMKPWKNEEGDE